MKRLHASTNNKPLAQVFAAAFVGSLGALGAIAAVTAVTVGTVAVKQIAPGIPMARATLTAPDSSYCSNRYCRRTLQMRLSDALTVAQWGQ